MAPVNKLRIYTLPKDKRTIAALHLDIAALHAGRHWELLPEGFREKNCAKGYPLPASKEELATIAALPVHKNGQNSAAIYIRRAKRAYLAVKDSGLEYLEPDERAHEAAMAHQRFTRQIADIKKDMREERDKVKAVAEEAIASVSALFDLAKRGLEGQMKAHLEDAEWKGEKINARAFRECFRMVTQTVKGLGLPSDDRNRSADAILDEVAEAHKARNGALAMAPNTKPDEPVH